MKVFGVGLNKTGTVSVAVAMRHLGFRTLHKGDAATSAQVDRAAVDGVPLLTYVGETWDAYFDVEAIVRRYSELDQQYVGSRFICTTRDKQEWLDSRERHVRANQANAAAGRYTGSFLEVDLGGWSELWDRHHAEVRAYFGDRRDLLEYRVTEGWEPLCAFLGCEIPSRPFPHENSLGAGTYAGRGRLAFARRSSSLAVAALRRRLGRARPRF